MSDTLELSCLVTNGRIPLEVSQAVAAALRRMDGKRVDLTLKKHVNTRSSNQNRYYFGVVVKACHEIFVAAGNDYTREDVHDFLKQYVGGDQFVRIFITPDGKRKAVVRSSATLSTEEFEHYMERCRVWAAENGREIPLPNESLIHRGK
jgi:biopolymer transport protein ExbD